MYYHGETLYYIHIIIYHSRAVCRHGKGQEEGEAPLPRPRRRGDAAAFRRDPRQGRLEAHQHTAVPRGGGAVRVRS